MKYKIYTNDIGPFRFSCLKTITAKSDSAAEARAIRIIENLPTSGEYPARVLWIPAQAEDDAHPHGETGEVPKWVLDRYGIELED